MQGYHARVVPRLEASLHAAYATSWDELASALGRYKVDVFLTAPSVWRKRSYDAPLDELARGLIARTQREGAVLRTPPPERILFRSGEVYVVRIRPSSGTGG
jgi:hypothetical protein